VVREKQRAYLALTLCRYRLGPLQLGGIGPESLETVVLARLFLEEMNNDVAVVEEDPFCLGSTFAAEWLNVEVIPKTLFN
jgi:hypothetical protein